MLSKEKKEHLKDMQYRLISNLLHSIIIRIFLATLIFLGVGAIIAQSFEEMDRYVYLFYVISFFSALIFTIEYILRIISAPLSYPHLSAFKARIKYLTSFMGIIDFIAILPFTVPYFFDVSIVRSVFELARLFLIFKIFRYSYSYKIICTVLSTVKYELFTTISFGGVIVCFCAVMMYYVERTAQPEAFSNIGEGFWWALITFTSVGYGDIYPITSLGKILTSCMLVIGIGVMALPSAIVSAAFINYIHDNKEFMIKRTLPDEVKSHKKKEHNHNNYCSHCGQIITDKKDNDIS